jgi:AraC-like DNA-binding protein
MVSERTETATDAAYRPRTGHAPVDAVRYRREPSIEAFRHPEPGILLYRMRYFGQSGAYTTAERGSGETDLLLLSRGGGMPASGHIGGQRFELKPNKALRATFVPEDADASVLFGVSAYSTNLMFPKGYLARLLEGQRHGSFGPVAFQSDERLMRLMQMLDAEIAAPGFASRILVEGLSRAIATILTRLDTNPAREVADRIHLTPRKLKLVVDLVEANLAEHISLSDMARVAGLSPFHFSRVFKLATGSSPYQFVTGRRVDRALRLLSEDSMSIAEVALACGFANQSHFTAAFTRSMGISPGRYRQGRQH